MRDGHHCRLRHLGMLHQDGLDLGGGHEVAGHIEHVVNPPRDPDVAVLVSLGPVTRHVVAREPGEVSFLKPLLVSVDCPHHSGPNNYRFIN